MVQSRKQNRRTSRFNQFSSYEHYDFHFENLEPRSMLIAGDLDPTFGIGGKVTTDFAGADYGEAIAIQTDGKIVVGGSAPGSGGRDFALARYNIDGSLDPGFGAGGRVVTEFPSSFEQISDVQIQTDGKIVAAGESDGNFALARYNTDGSLDENFGVAGRVTTDFAGAHDRITSLAIRPDGEIVVGGFADAPSRMFALAQYHVDGSLNQSFGVHGRVTTDFGPSNDVIQGIALQADCKIVVAGYGGSAAHITFALARYDENGNLDPSFDGDGKVTTDFVDGAAFEVVIQKDGKIVAGGYGARPSAPLAVNFALARYKIDGSPDTSFGSDGTVVSNLDGPAQTSLQELALQADGKIIAAGVSSNLDFRVERYNTDGSVDTGFGTGGIITTDFFGGDDNAYSVAIQADGKIVAAGTTLNNGVYDFALARYEGDIQTTAITGFVYNDENNDGGFQSGSGESGLVGISVALVGTDMSNNSVNRSIISLSDGSFNFEGVLAGTYSLISDQPIGFLDGRETAGSGGGTVDNSGDSKTITGIVIGNDGIAAVDYFFGNIRPAEISGLVWEDFNVDGQVNFGEHAIDNAIVTLTGTDDRGNAVNIDSTTDADGIFMFFDLRPGEYQLVESQPAGFVDASEVLGTINGITVGSIFGNDRFANLSLNPGAIGINYNFAERPGDSGQITTGQTASIGFWQNKNGRDLILALNGGATSTQLSSWLAQTLPNMYGLSAGANNLAGKTNIQVWDFYNGLFRRKQQEARALGLGGPVKTDAQVFATALAVYVTNQSLAGFTATSCGFVVSANGVGASSVNVGNSGQAFGVANGTTISIMDLLLAVNARTRNGILYDLDSDGDADDSVEVNLRILANYVFTAVNDTGGR